MKYGCIGEKLGHSFSREIHGLLGSYPYQLKEIAKCDLDSFMKTKDFLGINVTIPYKQAVMPYLDEIDLRAQRIGAVNTIVNRDGKLYGYNTDYFGLKALIQKNEIDCVGKKAIILGSGGTSKTARCVLQDLGADSVITVGRKAAYDCIDYATMYTRHSDAQIIVNTTPVGMYPACEDIPIDLDRFDRLCGVIDVIYNPLRTNLVLAAKKRNIPAEGGLFMLVAQALFASEYFLNTTYDDKTLHEVFKTIKKRKENTVLIGMPGCGKTTIGREIAKESSFFDTDEEILRLIPTSIRDFILKNGEAAFRDLEEKTIETVSLQTGAVISVGGGAVLRENNVRRLKRNGRLIFLNMPLDRILPTDDRPLSDSVEKLNDLYHARLPVYLAAADFILVPAETMESTKQLVLEAIQ